MCVCMYMCIYIYIYIILFSSHTGIPNCASGQGNIATPTRNDATRANSSQNDAKDRKMQKAETDRELREPLISQSTNMWNPLKLNPQTPQEP